MAQCYNGKRACSHVGFTHRTSRGLECRHIERALPLYWPSKMRIPLRRLSTLLRHTSRPFIRMLNQDKLISQYASKALLWWPTVTIGPYFDSSSVLKWYEIGVHSKFKSPLELESTEHAVKQRDLTVRRLNTIDGVQ